MSSPCFPCNCLCTCRTVSKRIVDLHQGKLSVHSEGNGLGATFTLLLPPGSALNESEAAQLSLSRHSVDSSLRRGTSDSLHRMSSLRRVRHHPSSLLNSIDDSESDWSSHAEVRSFQSVFDSSDDDVRNTALILSRVLVVDDSDLNRKMMCLRLQSKFDEILQAEDGAQAVALVASRLESDSLPQVILMDFMMPIMNGPTATAEIRAMGYSGVVVGVTGNTLQQDIDELLRSGANRVLPKPLDLKALKTALQGAHLVLYLLFCMSLG